MIIEPPRKRPPKVFWLPIWRCKKCDRIMLFERGVNRWSGFFLERINVCPECDRDYKSVYAALTERSIGDE